MLYFQQQITGIIGWLVGSLSDHFLNSLPLIHWEELLAAFDLGTVSTDVSIWYLHLANICQRTHCTSPRLSTTAIPFKFLSEGFLMYCYYVTLGKGGCKCVVAEAVRFSHRPALGCAYPHCAEVGGTVIQKDGCGGEEMKTD